jgi:hypothetical protein
MRRPSATQRWTIALCFAGGLALGGLVAYGLMSRWGADQWGPFAAWLSGLATLAAVIVALRQADIARHESRDLQLARLVDHEVSRRRECIEALGDLWTALIGLSMKFDSFTAYLDRLPKDFAKRLRVADDVPPERFGEPFANEYLRHVEDFYNEWIQATQPPLFVALAILHGTGMHRTVHELNELMKKMSAEDTEGGFVDIRKAIVAGHRPDTNPLTAMWRDIIALRYEHLRLATQHFSLKREDVERAVRG